MSKDRLTTATYALIVIFIIYTALRWLGGPLFTNSWSFTHWQHLPWWYGPLWIIAAAAVAYVFVRKREALSSVVRRRRNVVIGLLVLLGLLLLFRFDSILYGGGTSRIAQLSQVSDIVIRWYEAGTLWLAAQLHSIFLQFTLPVPEVQQSNEAALYAWRTLSIAATILSLIASVLLARRLARGNGLHWLWFWLLLGGAQTPLLFGFVGHEPIFVAVTMWFALWAHRSLTDGDGPAKGLLWLTVIVGAVLHASLLYLLPAAVYISLSSKRREHISAVGLVASLAVYVALVAGLFVTAAGDMELSKYVLPLGSRLPTGDYRLFSGRHLGDIIQVLLLAIPAAFAVKVHALASRGWLRGNHTGVAAWLMTLAGFTLAFVYSPRDGIVADLPFLLACLTPVSVCIAFYVARLEVTAPAGGRFLALLAAASVMFPLAYLPTYTRIHDADTYVEAYLDAQPAYYRRVAVAFRDAYYARQEYPDADRWEWRIPIHSPDHLEYRGMRDLVGSQDFDDALKSGYKLIARNPYWTDVRSMTAMTLSNLKRYDLAKAQMDTCLMIEPYVADHYQKYYAIYRDEQRYDSAIAILERGLDLFPHNVELQTDRMIVAYRAGDLETAADLTNELIAIDSTLPYPYVIRGFILERMGQPRDAIDYYRKFIRHGPMEPDVPRIQEMIRHIEDSLPAPADDSIGM